MREKTDNVRPEQSSTTTAEPEVAVEPARVPKKVECPRCKGDGIWHSNRTGVRVATAAEPLVDASKACPACKGTKQVTIMITKEQADAEARAKARAERTATAARKARANADTAEAAAVEAEKGVKG